MSIPLPPLPPCPDDTYDWSEDEKDTIRARDLEVARVVLEAAAEECESMWGGRNSMSDAIRELEFHHAE